MSLLARRILILVLGQWALLLLFCWSSLFRSYSSVAWRWTGLLAVGTAFFFLVWNWLEKKEERSWN